VVDVGRIFFSKNTVEKGGEKPVVCHPSMRFLPLPADDRISVFSLFFSKKRKKGP
jgi:hypothetical protein